MAAHLAFSLSSFWAVLYAVRTYRRRNASHPILPTLSAPDPPHSDLFSSRTTHVSLRNFHLGMQSTALNAFHRSVSLRLSQNRRWTVLLRWVYDAGSVVCVLGMSCSILLLAWTTVHLAFLHNTSELDTSLQKRAIPGDDSPALNDPPRPPLQLIIPGITAPLHHLPIILIALLTTQIIHEAGHAIAAALESVTLGSVGLGFTVILPSAFVALPAGETESLPPRSRARIISAGAYHNLVFFLVLVLAACSGLAKLIWPILGYRDVSAYGRVVVNVDEDSPLYGHLPSGAVVYKVGDNTLDNGGGAAREWDALLSSRPDQSAAALGWCAADFWFTSQGSSCCSAQRSTQVSSRACFTPLEDHRSERCVDPLVFLDSFGGRRCTSAVDCGHGHVCVGPRGDQELVSLTMHVSPWLRAGNDDKDMERTVVWQGDGMEILREVEVGDWLPAYSLLPVGLPVLCSVFFKYLEMLTLSLYFFNLLPLPFLDGGQLLDTLYDWVMSGKVSGDETEFVILDALESGAEVERSAVARTQAWTSHDDLEGRARRIRIVHIGVGVLLGLCILLSLMNANLW